ncbi:hypothetical protein LZ31DRAFT_224821 [Colletotrichum somersetense]|nr:hypothetical protein LZ31DRAFT_224821 [Colletotrichum somersetense]
MQWRLSNASTSGRGILGSLRCRVPVCLYVCVSVCLVCLGPSVCEMTYEKSRSMLLRSVFLYCQVLIEGLGQKAAAPPVTDRHAGSVVSTRAEDYRYSHAKVAIIVYLATLRGTNRLEKCTLVFVRQVCTVVG